MLRKALLGAVAGMALLASPAQADFNLYGDVDKNVDIYIWEGVFKLKLAAFLVLIIDNPEKVAKSQVVFNQRNQLNHACENCAEKLDLIAGSIIGNAGITTVNQASGNMNNQANLVSVAWANVSEPPPPPPPGNGDPGTNTGHANSQVAGEQILGNGSAGFRDNPDGTREHILETGNGNTVRTINVPFRDAVIRGSINENSGITQVNQAPGNINNQANGMSLAFTFYNGIALSDTALGQWNAGNTVEERNVSKFASIAGSVNENTGVTQVNQAAGVLANQSNVVSLAVTGLGLSQR